MILPIGHDQTSVERLPWLTLVLVAALVVGFFLARGGVGIASDAPEVKLDSALEVWLSHPYLDPDPALLELARADDAAAERVAQARAIAARVDVDTVTRLHQQTELDDVTRLALRGSDAEPGPAHPFRRFGWVPAAPRALALAAHPFMHVGYAHLCLVLLLLWLAGPALEDAFGPWLFGALCAGGVLASATGYWLTEPNAEAPLIGASGLAAGLLGAFAVRHARGQIRFAWVSFARMRLASGTFSAPAWIALPLWLLASAGLHFLFGESHVETGESLAPSLSALAFGALAAFGLGTLRVEERWVRAAREARTVVKLDPRIQRALDAHARGAHDQAIQLATAVLRERPDDPDALLAVWSAEVAAGREAQGAVAAKRLIEVHARHGELAAAARLYAELVRVLPDVKLDTTVLLRVVPELVLQARREAAIAALRAVVSPENRSLTVGQAVRAAELGAELDPPCALSAARRALAPADLAPERREKLLRLVRELEAKVCDVPTEVQPAPAAAAAPAAPPAEPASPPSAPPHPPEPAIERTSYGEMPTVIYTAPAAAPPSPAPAPEPLEPGPAKITLAVPVELDPAGLQLRIEGAAPTLLAWERIQAVGVGLVSGLGAKPVVVIDLALNWAESHGEGLEVLRLRSDSFRARSLVGGDGSALEALRALLAQLLARSGAVPLPDGGSARGLPFREFPDPSSYEREVLQQAG